MVSDQSAPNLMINELLCFIIDKMNVLPPNTIIQLFLSKYNELEVETSKKVLFDNLPSEISVRLQKRQGDKKALRNLEDIIKVVQEFSYSLPTYAAKNLNNLPPITFDNIDVSMLLDEICKTNEKVRFLQDCVTKQQSTKNSLIKTHETH